MTDIHEILELLNSIEEDSSVPKNVRSRISETIICLKDGSGDSAAIIVDRAIQNLDELSTDPNMPTYTRTQIWNVISALESK